MNDITQHLSRLGHFISRLGRRLHRRPVTLDAKLSVNLFIFKLELSLKSEPPKPANDNHRRSVPRRSA